MPPPRRINGARVPASASPPVHQAVSGGHQRVETGMAGGIIFDAAPGERQLPGIGRLLVETRHVVAERLHRRRGIVAAGIGEQNDKFVPLPREDIGLAEGRFHQVGDGDQRAIALFMPPVSLMCLKRSRSTNARLTGSWRRWAVSRAYSARVRNPGD